MQATLASQCLTRIVLDDRTVELVQLRVVLERIQQVLPRIPAAEREYIANALLNLAVAAVEKPMEDRKPSS